SKSLVDMNKSYATTVNAMSEMASASKDAKDYHSQVQNVTKNLGALNKVYELELNDANSHLKAMNKFYSNVTAAMENVAQASKESEQFKKEMSNLTTNISNLNKVYGNMLTAMKGS
ncbi:MAG: gliding motility protein GldL, partial [Cyclobacteriaceae bacterium]